MRKLLLNRNIFFFSNNKFIGIGPRGVLGIVVFNYLLKNTCFSGIYENV